MRPLTKLSSTVWKLDAGSNVYLLILPEPVVIDTGERRHRDAFGMLDKICPLSSVRHVIFTHLHYDHVGNWDLFPNAVRYASEAEMRALADNRVGALLDPHLAERFTPELCPAVDLQGLKVIATPGHTVGSICVYYPAERMLFSGDTLFSRRQVGRTDLPTSSPSMLHESLMALVEVPYKVLCPGHDY